MFKHIFVQPILLNYIRIKEESLGLFTECSGFDMLYDNQFDAPRSFKVSVFLESAKKSKDHAWQALCQAIEERYDGDALIAFIPDL